jgi:hypothetical protein
LVLDAPEEKAEEKKPKGRESRFFGLAVNETELTRLEDLEGWETFTAGMQRFLYYLPFCATKAEAAKKADLKPNTIYGFIVKNAVFKEALKQRELSSAARMPGGRTELLVIDLVGKAVKEVYDRLERPAETAAHDKVKMDVAMWCIKNLGKAKMEIEMGKGTDLEVDGDPHADGLGLKWKAPESPEDLVDRNGASEGNT